MRLQRIYLALPVDQRIEILNKIQARHQAGLLAVNGVRAVGIGLDEPDIMLVTY